MEPIVAQIDNADDNFHRVNIIVAFQTKYVFFTFRCFF